MDRHSDENTKPMNSPAAGIPQADDVSRIVDRWKMLDASFASALETGIPLPLALNRLGVNLFLRGDNVESREVLGAAQSVLPNEPSIANNLAVVLDRLDQTDEAVRCSQRSLTIDPAQTDSWVFLGNLKRKKGDLPGAAAAYESAIALNSNSPLAWQGLGFVRKDQLKPAEAIECFITSIRQSGATAPLLSILGQLFYLTGQFEKSRDAYSAAVEFDGSNAVYRKMVRETNFFCAAIAGDALDGALGVYQSDVAARPAAADKTVPELLSTAFSLLSAYGHADAARRVGQYRVELYPDSATASYLLAAVSGDASIARSPDAYLVEHFDSFATRFDEQLVKNLGYDVPEQLGFMLAAIVPSDSRVDVLDAGCGTGLCGPWVRGMATTLTGVDISQGMLNQAERRGIYDRLICEELTTFLRMSPEQYGMIIAADVMIYFGDLSDLGGALAIALKPGGLLAFSIERTAGRKHQLLPSGRFAHDPDYVRSLLSGDFVEVRSERTTVRLEALEPVAGDVFVFRRRSH